jgi:multiple sugar transport system permease protein
VLSDLPPAWRVKRIIRYLLLYMVAYGLTIIPTFLLFKAFGWLDTYNPLIHLNTPEKYTLSLGLANFQRVVSAGGQATEHLLMAASMVMTLPSILVFILLQRYYIQGVVISSGSK